MTEQKTVALVDYNMGNLWSVQTALEYLGADVHLVAEPERLSEFSHIILPGVGSFKLAMTVLRERGMVEAIQTAVATGKQVMGICLGMQLMAKDSSEDCADGEVTAGLGLIANSVRRFDLNPRQRLKIPHVGFNTVSIESPQGLFASLGEQADFYFTHSYRLLRGEFSGNAAMCEHGETFLAAFEEGNICGAQFHPEKSQTNGLLMLKNFLEKTSC